MQHDKETFSCHILTWSFLLIQWGAKKSRTFFLTRPYHREYRSFRPTLYKPFRVCIPKAGGSKFFVGRLNRRCIIFRSKATSIAKRETPDRHKVFHLRARRFLNMHHVVVAVRWKSARNYIAKETKEPPRARKVVRNETKRRLRWLFMCVLSLFQLTLRVPADCRRKRIESVSHSPGTTRESRVSTELNNRRRRRGRCRKWNFCPGKQLIRSISSRDSTGHLEDSAINRMITSSFFTADRTKSHFLGEKSYAWMV